jgi:hypothetical protein
VELDKAASQIRAMTKSHLRQLLLWFAASLVCTVISFEICTWAAERRGWQGSVVEFIFGAIAAVSGFTVIMLGALLYGWLRSHEAAVRDCAYLIKQPDVFFRMHRDALGPIMWR